MSYVLVVVAVSAVLYAHDVILNPIENVWGMYTPVVIYDHKYCQCQLLGVLDDGQALTIQ